MAEKTQKQLEEEKKQIDFLDEAAELDDELDLDNEGASEDSTDEDESGAQISDADIAAAEGKGDGAAPEAKKPGEQPAGEVAPGSEQAGAAPATESKAEVTAPSQAAEEKKVEAGGAPAAETPVAPEPSQDINEVYQNWRENAETLLADHHYALNEQDAAELNENPGRAIPRLMSRVYLDAVTAAIGQITSNLPRLVRIVNDQNASLTKSENQFFETWPDLKDHVDMVTRIGTEYRQRNPTATAEQFINEVGAASMVALKLDPSKGAVPATPAAPKAPFTPAATTPQGGLQKPATPINPWEELNNEFDAEEEIELGR